jgi:hypothetical protein
VFSQNGFDVESTIVDLCKKTNSDPRNAMRRWNSNVETDVQQPKQQQQQPKKASQSTPLLALPSKRLHTSEEVYHKIKVCNKRKKLLRLQYN